MAITIQPPQPGDLITASFMQQLIQQMQGLDTRLSALEGVTPGADGKISISKILPADAVPGDTIQIIGVNFGLPSQDIVTFDGGHAVVPTSGGDKQLTVVVPTIDLGTATAKSVSVGVSGGSRGFDAYPLTVHAIQATVPAGTITVSPGTIPANIAPGGSFVFPFTIQARTNLDETYTLTPGVPPVAQGQTAWTAVVTSDSGGNTVLQQPLLIPKPPNGQTASTAQVYVKVTIPANTPVTSPFVQLDVTSVHNPPPNPGSPSGSSGPVSFQFNSQQQPPQTVSFAISTFTGSGVTGDTKMVSIPLPTPTTPPVDGINYLFQNLKTGQYQMTLQWQDTSNGNRGWVASFGGAPGLGSWPVTSKTIQMSTAGDWGPEKVAVTGITGATQNTLIVTVRAVGANSQTDYGILNQGIKPA